MERRWTARIVFIFAITALWGMFIWMAGIKLGLDLKGGFELTYRVEPATEAAKASPTKMMQQTIEVLQKRVNALGLKDIYIATAGRNAIIVDLPGGTEADKRSVQRLIERMGHLEFRLVAEDFRPWPDTDRPKARAALSQEDVEKNKKKMEECRKANEKALAAGKKAPYEFLPRIQYRAETLTRGAEPKTIPRARWPEMPLETGEESRVSGKYLKHVGPSRTGLGEPAVSFTFDAVGRSRFYELTSKNVKRHLAIVLDEVVYSAPVIREAIHGTGQISGRFTPEEVRRLVAILEGGALAGKLILEGEYQVGPTLGEQAIHWGFIAIVLSLVAVLSFMGAYYMAGGLVADLSMLINLVLIAGTLAASEATFTLPGLAGLVLTVGMAVDANILIFERIREERRSGKSLRQSLELGFKRAFWTIFDANVTTLITAIILMSAGTGPVKGFAVVLAIGIVCTVFCALFVSHAFMNALVDRRIVRKFRMMQIVREPRFDFVRWMKPALMISGMMVVGGLVLFFMRGTDKYGIEFTGGINYQMLMARPMRTADVRSRVGKVTLLEDVTVSGLYSGAEGEDPTRGVATQFVIKARLAEGKRKKGASSAEEVAGHIGRALADVMAPEAFPQQALQDRLEQDKQRRKFVYDVVMRRMLPESELKKRLQEALRGAISSVLVPQTVKPTVTDLKPKDVGLPPEEKGFVVFRVDSGPLKLLCTGPNGKETPAVWEREYMKVRGELSGRLTVTEKEMLEPLPLTPTDRTREVERTSAEAGTLIVHILMRRFMREAWLKASLEEVARAAANELAGGATTKVEFVEPTTVGLPKTSAEGAVLVRVSVGPLGERFRADMDGLRERFRKLIVDEVKDRASGATRPLLSRRFLRKQDIGPAVAYDLKSKAFVALILAVIAIVIYIAIRFEFLYGIAAVVALVHDVSIALGINMLLDMLGVMEIKIDLPVIAAFLTIVGYSLNDTIVVFDRIRENIRHRRFEIGSRRRFADIVNESINACLSRTLLTSATTFMAIFVLFLFGAASLRGFTVTMLIGVVVGTYSSIYIASPILLLMRAERYEAARVRREEEKKKRKQKAEEAVAREEKKEEEEEEYPAVSPDMDGYAERQMEAERSRQKRKKKKKKRKKRK